MEDGNSKGNESDEVLVVNSRRKQLATAARAALVCIGQTSDGPSIETYKVV
jgi:hypothetical protein